MKVFQNDNITIDDYKVKFVSTVSNFGVHLNSNLYDDGDIARQERCLYVTANKLKARFSRCSTQIKNVLFRAFMPVNCGIILL